MSQDAYISIIVLRLLATYQSCHPGNILSVHQGSSDAFQFVEAVTLRHPGCSQVNALTYFSRSITILIAQYGLTKLLITAHLFDETLIDVFGDQWLQSFGDSVKESSNSVWLNSRRGSKIHFTTVQFHLYNL